MYPPICRPQRGNDTGLQRLPAVIHSHLKLTFTNLKQISPTTSFFFFVPAPHDITISHGRDFAIMDKCPLFPKVQNKSPSVVVSVYSFYIRRQNTLRKTASTSRNILLSREGRRDHAGNTCNLCNHVYSEQGTRPGCVDRKVQVQALHK